MYITDIVNVFFLSERVCAPYDKVLHYYVKYAMPMENVQMILKCGNYPRYTKIISQDTQRLGEQL